MQVLRRKEQKKCTIASMIQDRDCSSVGRFELKIPRLPGMYFRLRLIQSQIGNNSECKEEKYGKLAASRL